jgi:hypothetical protein
LSRRRRPAITCALSLTLTCSASALSSTLSPARPLRSSSARPGGAFGHPMTCPPTRPGLGSSSESLAASGDDIAVAIGLTHDIGEAVRQTLKAFRGLAVLSAFASGRSVKCGRHAYLLAEAVTAGLRVGRPQDRRPRTTHIFTAGPQRLCVFSRLASRRTRPHRGLRVGS